MAPSVEKWMAAEDTPSGSSMRASKERVLPSAVIVTSPTGAASFSRS